MFARALVGQSGGSEAAVVSLPTQGRRMQGRDGMRWVRSCRPTCFAATSQHYDGLRSKFILDHAAYGRVHVLEAHARHGQGAQAGDELLVNCRTVARQRTTPDLPPRRQPILGELFEGDCGGSCVRALIDLTQRLGETPLRSVLDFEFALPAEIPVQVAVHYRPGLAGTDWLDDVTTLAQRCVPPGLAAPPVIISCARPRIQVR